MAADGTLFNRHKSAAIPPAWDTLTSAFYRRNDKQDCLAHTKYSAWDQGKRPRKAQGLRWWVKTKPAIAGNRQGWVNFRSAILLIFTSALTIHNIALRPTRRPVRQLHKTEGGHEPVCPDQYGRDESQPVRVFGMSVDPLMPKTRTAALIGRRPRLRRGTWDISSPVCA